MKFFFKRKDGGQDSFVTGYWLVEAKNGFSICLLRFDEQTRENFHNHAFNCVSVVLSGELHEEFIDGRVVMHPASWKPFRTLRTHFHRVKGTRVSWVFSLRGPWTKIWNEQTPAGKQITLAQGRKVVGKSTGVQNEQ
jgi:hypothetical protein